jgi:hypothetical protein
VTVRARLQVHGPVDDLPVPGGVQFAQVRHTV